MIMDDMNCLSARRIITTDLTDKSPAFVKHLGACPQCKSFYERQLKFNNTLKKAVEVDVPEGLAARILVEHKLNKKKANDQKFRWSAIAASALLVLVVSSVTTLHSPPALADAIVEHVKYDTGAFANSYDVTLEQLNLLLKPHGIQADATIGKATNAGNCLIDGKVGAHIVFAGKNAPVTLVVMPEKLGKKDSVKINDNVYKGSLMSTKKGTLALLSEDEESLTLFEEKVRTSLMTFI